MHIPERTVVHMTLRGHATALMTTVVKPVVRTVMHLHVQLLVQHKVGM